MKPTKFFATTIVAAGMLFFSSCNSGDEKKTDKNNADSTAVTTETPAASAVAPPGPTSMTIIKHKVANYAKWKPYYDEDDSVRLAHGLHNYVIARGTEDSNMVLIAMRMDNVIKAKEMVSTSELKDRMKKAGVIGTPMIDFIETVLSDTTAIQQTVRLLVTHKVKDWDAWKNVFDSHKQTRADAGLTDRVVAHTVRNNKNVSLVFAVADMDKAKAFINSKDLKDKMAEAGVDGPPAFFFYKVVERY